MWCLEVPILFREALILRGGVWCLEVPILFREALKDDLGTSGGKLIMAIKQREDVEETLKEYEGKCRNVEVVLKEYEEECTKLIAVSTPGKWLPR